MKYQKINSTKQYNEYCDIHEDLIYKELPEDQEVIELLEMLIDEYDQRDSDDNDIDLNPVELLRFIIREKRIKIEKLAIDLDEPIESIKDILSYKKGFSQTIVTKLTKYFALSRNAFSRPYPSKE